MSWLLIYIVAAGWNAELTTAAVQFGTREACDAAGTTMQQEWNRYYRGHICVSLYAASPTPSK